VIVVAAADGDFIFSAGMDGGYYEIGHGASSQELGRDRWITPQLI
jgi:hypothetical protein